MGVDQGQAVGGAGQGNGARTPCSQAKLRAFSGILPLPLAMTETLSNEVWVNEKEGVKNMEKRTEGKRIQSYGQTENAHG